MSDQTDIGAWLADLATALHPLPEAERADIVAEARGHLDEQVAAGLNARAALDGFGSPAAYAQPFLDDFAVARALDSRRSLPMVKALLSRARRSLVAALGLSGTLFFALLALIGLFALLQKIGLPHDTGIWSDGLHHMCVGTCQTHVGMREVLGGSYYLLTAGVVVLGLYLARQCLRLAGFIIVSKGK